MREDAHRLRAGSSAQVMAALRNTAITVLHLTGFTEPPPTVKNWVSRPSRRPPCTLRCGLAPRARRPAGSRNWP